MNDDIIEYLKSIGFKENRYGALERNWFKGIAIMVDGGTSRELICDEEFLPKTSSVLEVQKKIRCHNKKIS